MPIYCASCSNNVTAQKFPGIKCGSCAQVFHIKCLDLSAEMISNIHAGSAAWLCPACRCTSRKSVIDYREITDTAIPENPTLHDVMVVLTNVQQKLNDLERSQQFISNTMDELNSRVSILTSENRSMKSKLTHMEKEMDAYDIKLSWLEDQIDVSNQIKNSRNVVVCGLPGNTLVTHELFTKAVQKLGVNVSKDDIVSIEKMKLISEDKGSLKNSYIITLNTLELKQQILSSFRSNKQPLFWNGVDDTLEKSRIRLLHHFTKHQSKLYTEAKKFKVKFNYRFLWCTNNKILLRKVPDSDVFHVRSLNDLNRLHRSFQRADKTMGRVFIFTGY